LANALLALTHFDMNPIDRVIADERRLNVIEIDIDAECGNIIARRQPAARDPRFRWPYRAATTRTIRSR
jgi:phosphate transport system protein